MGNCVGAQGNSPVKKNSLFNEIKNSKSVYIAPKDMQKYNDKEKAKQLKAEKKQQQKEQDKQQQYIEVIKEESENQIENQVTQHGSARSVQKIQPEQQLQEEFNKKVVQDLSKSFVFNVDFNQQGQNQQKNDEKPVENLKLKFNNIAKIITLDNIQEELQEFDKLSTKNSSAVSKNSCDKQIQQQVIV